MATVSAVVSASGDCQGGGNALTRQQCQDWFSQNKGTQGVNADPFFCSTKPNQLCGLSGATPKDACVLRNGNAYWSVGFLVGPSACTNANKCICSSTACPTCTSSPTPVPTTRAPTPVPTRRPTPAPLPSVPMLQSTAYMLMLENYAPAGQLTGMPPATVRECRAPSSPASAISGQGEGAGHAGAAAGAAMTLGVLLLLPWLAARRNLAARLAGVPANPARAGGAVGAREAWRPGLFLAFACGLYANAVYAWGRAQEDGSRSLTPAQLHWAAANSCGVQGLASFIGSWHAFRAFRRAKQAKAAGTHPGVKPSLLALLSVSLYMMSQAVVAWSQRVQLELKPKTFCSNQRCFEPPLGRSAAGYADCIADYTSCTFSRDVQVLACKVSLRPAAQLGGGISALFAFGASAAALAAASTRLGFKRAADIQRGARQVLSTTLGPTRGVLASMLFLLVGGVILALVGLVGTQFELAVSVSGRVTVVAVTLLSDVSNAPSEIKAALAFSLLAFISSTGAAAARLVGMRKQTPIRHRLLGFGTLAAAVSFFGAFAAVAKYYHDLPVASQRLSNFGAGFTCNALGCLLMVLHAGIALLAIKGDSDPEPAGERECVPLPRTLVAAIFAWCAFALDVAAKNTVFAVNQYRYEACTWAVDGCDSDDAECRDAAAAARPLCQFNAQTFPLSAYEASHNVPGVLELLAALLLALILLSARQGGAVARRFAQPRADGAEGVRDFVWFARTGALCLAMCARAHQSLSLGSMSEDAEQISGWVCTLYLAGAFVAWAGSAFASVCAFTPLAGDGQRAAAKAAFWAPWNLLNCALGCLLFALAVQSGKIADSIAQAAKGVSPAPPQATVVIMGLAATVGVCFALLAALMPDVQRGAALRWPAPACELPEAVSGRAGSARGAAGGASGGGAAQPAAVAAGRASGGAAAQPAAAAAAAPAPAPAPAGPVWQECVDEASGHPYFYNNATGETTWERPVGLGTSNPMSAWVTEKHADEPERDSQL